MGPTFVSVCFVGKNDANTGLQIKLSDQSPLAENAAKGPCFHLLELTQRVGLRGEKTIKNRPYNSNARFLINGG